MTQSPSYSPRFWLAVAAGRLVFWLLRLLGRGATSLPGYVALIIDPRFLERAAKRQQIIVVTGTNGKTTTANLLSFILRQAGRCVLSNPAGSNLPQGIASAFLMNRSADVAVFEIDEALLPHIAAQLKPSTIIMQNLFRDQMDRYGEVDKTKRAWQELVKTLPKKTQLLLNADDPSVAHLGLGRENSYYFGLDDRSVGQATLPLTADSVLSPLDSATLTYDWVYFGHLGHYHSTGLSFARPKSDYEATSIRLAGFQGSQFKLRAGKNSLKVKTPLPALYNIYNVLAAASAASELGVSPTIIVQAIENFPGVFGRFETVSLKDGRRLILFLIKNPVGFDQVIEALHLTPESKDMLIAINDEIADGRDVSWLWDAGVEQLIDVSRRVIASGNRAHDMALRLKYAELAAGKLQIENRLGRAIQLLLAEQPKTLYALCTYTAMLELHRLLSKEHLVQPFFQTKETLHD